jgi:NAD(P)H-dependent FMN reductase
LFRPEDLEVELPIEVKKFKEKLNQADFVMIATPEYTHNIPAVLKNAFEWVTASGEFQEKKIFAMTFTPNEPRGKYAMESLLFSLKGLNANVVGQVSLYKNEVRFEDYKIHLPTELLVLFEEILK